jgi:CBS domain-containing protein
VLDWKVEKVMTSPAITVTRDVAVLTALSQMSRKRIRHLPVVDGDQLIGSSRSAISSPTGSRRSSRKPRRCAPTSRARELRR